MSVETDADRLIFLDPDAFGVAAVYAPRDGSAPVTITGIFDNEAATFDPNRWPGSQYQQQMGAHFDSTGPRFRCRFSDLPDGGKKGSKLTAYGLTYRVERPAPDGTGMVDLILMEDGE